MNEFNSLLNFFLIRSQITNLNIKMVSKIFFCQLLNFFNHCSWKHHKNQIKFLSLDHPWFLLATNLLISTFVPLLWDMGYNFINWLFKIKLNHLISFIKYQKTTLCQNQGPSIKRIFNSPRSSNNNLDPPANNRSLFFLAFPSDNYNRPKSCIFG